MEGDRLLFEDALASTSVQVKKQGVGMSVDFIQNIAQELNGEARKGISKTHDSQSNNEGVQLQRERTPVSHSQSETRIKVVEPSWSIFGRGQSLLWYYV
jgi:hypothetical protein